MSRQFSPKFISTTSLALAGAMVLPAAVQTASAQPAEITWNTTSKVSIVLPQNWTAPEQTAANELDNYLTKLTGGDFTVTTEPAAAPAGNVAPAIYVGTTRFATAAGVDAKTMPSEAWIMKTQNKSLILAGGGTRGTLYATYRFLEDIGGVRWWNPWEETVPARRVLSIPTLNKSGKPSFAYRDIYMLYGNDKGRFAIRNRLDREGDSPIGAEYGGSRNYGPPYHVHTLYMIMSPDKYYAQHPDWFTVRGDGVPTAGTGQLAFSNPGMRQEFLKLLRDMIRKSHADAKANGLPVPDVFSVSQLDNTLEFASTPEDKKLVEENGGADAAVLLDFINFLADGIKDEFPGVYIDTLAYFSGEQAPTKIRPRDNVIIRLTDTTSNLIEPITAERNKDFRQKAESWSKVAKNLRIWDYAITFRYVGLPMPTTATYPTDLRFLLAHNFEGIFVEHEYPVTADMRDFKIWMQCKLFEDPHRDYDALVREFTDGFYGPAGVHVRKYIYALQAEADKMGKEKGYEEISWMIAAKPYNYLSVDFLVRANQMFDDAEKAAGADPVLQRRVRHARMPVDRFIGVMFPKLKVQWAKRGEIGKPIPLDLTKSVERSQQSWTEQITLRLPEAQREAEQNMAAAEKALLLRKVLPAPAKFSDLPAERVQTYDTLGARNYENQAKSVDDPTSEIGRVTRFEVPAAELERYKLPMPLGVYDTQGLKETLTTSIKPEDVPGPGYNWHKLGEVKLTGNDYIFFFWSWVIQLDIPNAFDEGNPNQTYEIWANIKFEGPDFPHGKADDKNAISIERVVLIKK
jgi:hypothetical protein